MKTSVIIATAFIIGGVGLAVFRWVAPPPPIAAAVDGVPAKASPSRASRTAATHPSMGSTKDDDLAARTRRSATAGRFTSARHGSAQPAAVPPDATNVAAGELMPVARAALESVGSNADSDELWAAAINDEDLSPDDRSDLIEDLNEVGFADPTHVTVAELPLIESRLELIETLAPDSMDDTNAAAFAEVYNDLSRMRDELTQPPAADDPVQLTVR